MAKVPEKKRIKRSTPGETSGEDKFQRIASDHPFANCIPKGDRVVIRRHLPKKKTESGILLPDSMSRQKKPTGVVVRIGPGKRDESGKLIPVDLKVGQQVVLTDYAGLEIRDPGLSRSEEDEFVMLREEDILAVLPLPLVNVFAFQE